MYRRKEVESLIGIPARRIQFYTENGLVPDVHKETGRGNERKYSRDDVFRLAVIQEMSDLGLGLATIKIFLRSDDSIQKYGEPKTLSYDRFKNGCTDCFIFERVIRGGELTYNYNTSPFDDYPMIDGKNIAGEPVLSFCVVNLPMIFSLIAF